MSADQKVYVVLSDGIVRVTTSVEEWAIVQGFNKMIDRMMARSPVNGLNVYPEGKHVNDLTQQLWFISSFRRMCAAGQQ